MPSASMFTCTLPPRSSSTSTVTLPSFISTFTLSGPFVEAVGAELMNAVGTLCADDATLMPPTTASKTSATNTDFQ